MKSLKWINKNFETALLIIFLAAMSLIMGMQVIARYVFNASMAWTEEFTRYLFVWSGFISISFCIQKKLSIRIDMLVERFGPKLRAAVFMVDYLLEFALFAYLIPYAYGYLRTTIDTSQVSTAMKMPMSILIAAPLVGFVLSEIRIIQKVVCLIKDLKKGGEEQCQP